MKVQFGISNVHYAIKTSTGYSAPVLMEGADTMTINNDGGGNDTIYKDNVKYYTRSSVNGKTGELQMAMFPESFLTDVLGQTAETGGGISEGPSDVGKEFALMWQIEGDEGGRRVVWFCCTSTVPTRTDTTITDSITEGMESVTITATPTEINGVKKTQYSCVTGDGNYANFFSAVPLVSA